MRDESTATPSLPKVVSFAIVKRQHGWHVVALQTQGHEVLQEKLLHSLPSLEQACWEYEIAAQWHYLQKEKVF